jgi:predicted nucleic acid-binding protein
VIYLDSSALLKLIFAEAESEALADWLGAGTPAGALVSSELARVEVLRGCRRADPATLPAARSLLAGLDLIPISGDVVDHAAEIEGTLLRSLDAIHLASAAVVRTALATFVTYDHRLGEAAAAAGLAVTAPGVESDEVGG